MAAKGAHRTRPLSPHTAAFAGLLLLLLLAASPDEFNVLLAAQVELHLITAGVALQHQRALLLQLL
jgi:hypothetical protein